MGDSVVIVISIILAAILMFVFPMLAMSSQNDKIAQVKVQSETADFVATISATGKITIENYDKFIQAIYATGNTYDVEFEATVSDGNVMKKTTTVNPTKIGEQEQFKVYTNEIMNRLQNTGVYELKQGDTVTVTVKNSNQTLFQTLQSVFYATTSDSAQITAKETTTVAAQGQ